METPKHLRPSDPPRTVMPSPAVVLALRGLRTFRYRKSGGWVFASKHFTPLQETAYRGCPFSIFVRVESTEL